MLTREQFATNLRRICNNVGDDLYEEGLRVFDKMAQDEIAPFTDNYRLPKSIVVALAQNGRITWQFSAEALKPIIRRIKRIIKNRP